MKFIKPKDWVTPEKNAEDNPLADCYTPLASVTTFFQVISYPFAAVVSGIGALAPEVKNG